MKDITKTEVGEVVSSISNDMAKLGLETFPEKKKFISIEELKKYLIPKISYLLDNDYDKLINALYRIDLDEEKLHELFSKKNREFIPEKLADLILERQVQKIYWRNKYRQGEI